MRETLEPGSITSRRTLWADAWDSYFPNLEVFSHMGLARVGDGKWARSSHGSSSEGWQYGLRLARETEERIGKETKGNG